MRILQSSVNMSATTSQLKTYTKKESARIWVDGINDDSKLSIKDAIKNNPALIDSLEISAEARSKENLQAASTIELSSEDNLLDISDEDKHKIMVIEKMLEYLTGKKFKILIPKRLLNKDKYMESAAAAANQQPQKKGWGMVYDFKETYTESQQLNFKSEGVVKTADGREINFSAELNMSRQFVSDKEIHIRAGDAKIDPLVINFNGTGAQLNPTRNFVFDIDSDGKSENLNFVDKDSGFLVLDKNSDGKINDGSEMFGPATNNGFAELSEYDADKNNWIDENDPIFEKLRIWTKDENGNDVLFALGQKGIGAIYLGNVDSNFDIKDSSNELLGSVAKTGIYLKENGKPGIIQHIDLSV